LLIEYGRRLDARDFHGWAALFAKDGVWIGGLGEAKGPAALEAMLVKTMGPAASPAPSGASSGPSPSPTGAPGPSGGPPAHSVHLLTNPQIHVDGDRATALSKWTFVAPNAEGRPAPAMVGHYVDALVREDGTWKFLRREAWGDVPFADPNAPPAAAPKPSP
jgi:hypothetical protein